MSLRVRSILAGLLVLLGAGAVSAQEAPELDRPARYVETKPPTAKERDHRKALKLYALGVLQERRNLLIEAVKSFEEARRLDPDVVAILKALIPLYLALERTDDALTACRRVLELDPNDHGTGYVYARQLRALGQTKKAMDVLRRTAKCPGLKKRPDQLAQVWFDMAALAEEAKDWAEAERSLRQVAAILEKPAALLAHGVLTRDEIDNQAAETYERLGRICLQAGRPARAVEAFGLAQKKDPVRAPRLAYNLAQVHQSQGKFAEALARLEEYLRTQPQGTEGYELKIQLQRKLGRGYDVVPGLVTASERDPNNASLKMLLAREYARAGRTDKAERVYTELLRKTTSPDIYRGLFALYKERGRFGADKVLDLFDGAIVKGAGTDKKPGIPSEAANARAMLIVLREDPELVRLLLPAAQDRLLRGQKMAYATRMLLATLAARTRQLEAAEAIYRSCLDRLTELKPAMEHEVYSGLIQVLLLRNKHAEVVAVCKQGLEKAEATNRGLFYRQMARAQLTLGNNKAALEAANSAVEVAQAENRLAALLDRVDVFSQSGQHDKAIAECQGLLKEYNQGSDLRAVRVSLSNAYAAAGKDDESEEQLRLVLKSDADDALASNNLGYHLADRNKSLAEAERLIRKAIELDRRQRSGGAAIGADADRDNAAYVDSLGWVLFRRGKLAEARVELEKASQLPGGDDDPVVWDHLADVYFRLGEKAKAAQAWKKALALFDAGARRKTDSRYKDIQGKLKLVKP
jgi:tetratricopeptide (TPR) repeat protein